MLGKLRPARETVTARDEELRVGQQAPHRAFIRLLGLAPVILDTFRFAVDLPTELGRDLEALQPGKRFCPADGPDADGTGVTRLAS
jgi:hypothetical protein